MTSALQSSIRQLHDLWTSAIAITSSSGFDTPEWRETLTAATTLQTQLLTTLPDDGRASIVRRTLTQPLDVTNVAVFIAGAQDALRMLDRAPAMRRPEALIS